MIGKRNDVDPLDLQPGEYGKWKGLWCCIPPGTDLLGNLSRHTITEHDDGTITVSPSILVRGGPHQSEEWHGYLEKGVWREC